MNEIKPTHIFPPKLSDLPFLWALAQSLNSFPVVCAAWHCCTCTWTLTQLPEAGTGHQSAQKGLLNGHVSLSTQHGCTSPALPWYRATLVFLHCPCSLLCQVSCPKSPVPYAQQSCEGRPGGHILHSVAGQPLHLLTSQHMEAGGREVQKKAALRTYHKDTYLFEHNTGYFSFLKSSHALVSRLTTLELMAELPCHTQRRLTGLSVSSKLPAFECEGCNKLFLR